MASIRRGLWVDSFDDYAYADILQKYTQVVPAGGAVVDSSTITNVGRRSTNGLRLSLSVNAAGGYTQSYRKVLDQPAAAGARWVSQICLNHTNPFTYNNSNSRIISALQGGSVQFCIKPNTNGTVSIYRGTGSLLDTTVAALTVGVVTNITLDVLIHASAGEVRLYFDEQLVKKLTGQNTKATGSATFDEIEIGPAAGNVGGQLPSWNIDDCYLMDAGTGSAITLSGDIGAADTSFSVSDGSVLPSAGPFRIQIDDEIMRVSSRSGNDLSGVTRGMGLTTPAAHTSGTDVRSCCPQGDINFGVIYMNANGTNRNFTPSTGTDDYPVVDEATGNGDTDYLSSSTPGDKISGNYPNVPVAGADLPFVMIAAQARKESTGTAGHKALFRHGGTDYLGTEYALSTSYKRYQEIYMEKPSDASAILEADVNGDEFGASKSS